jgi:hypothetical protein
MCPAKRNRHPTDPAGDGIAPHWTMVEQLDCNAFIEAKLPQAARLALG